MYRGGGIQQCVTASKLTNTPDNEEESDDCDKKDKEYSDECRDTNCKPNDIVST